MAGFTRDSVEKVKEASDIVEVISAYTDLRRAGTRFTGLCPFHDERSPSFSVDPTEKLYHCFGCGAGGDAISFVREIEHLDFVGAVERLAARAGIQLRYDDAAAGRERDRRQRLVEAVAVFRLLHEEHAPAAVAAPQATLMATLIRGLLDQQLPWGLVLVGVFVSITLELCGIHSLSFAVGSYLPIATTAPSGRRTTSGAGSSTGSSSPSRRGSGGSRISRR